MTSYYSPPPAPQPGGGDGSSDHRDLTHRTDANQHPAGAVQVAGSAQVVDPAGTTLQQWLAILDLNSTVKVNAILIAPQLGELDDGVQITWAWRREGAVAQPDATPPLPADWDFFQQFTWGEEYASQPGHRVLVMLPDDVFPSALAKIDPVEGFIPIPVLGGTVVAVGCAGNGFADRPSLWVGVNADDALTGATDPTTPATSFEPHTIAAGDVWLSSDLAGILAAFSGRPLSEAIRAIDNGLIGGALRADWYGSIDTDNPSGLEALTVRTLSPQFGGTFTATDSLVDQHDASPVDGQVALIDESDEAHQFARSGAWRIHDGDWERITVNLDDWAIVHNCGQTEVSTVMMSFSTGEELAHWNPIGKNWLDLAYGGPIAKMGSPLYRAATNPLTANFVRSQPDALWVADTLPMTPVKKRALAAIGYRGGPAGDEAWTALGCNGLPSAIRDARPTSVRDVPAAILPANDFEGKLLVAEMRGDYAGGDWFTDSIHLAWEGQHHPIKLTGDDAAIMWGAPGADFGIGVRVESGRQGLCYRFEWIDEDAVAHTWNSPIIDDPISAPLTVHTGDFTLSNDGTVTLTINGTPIDGLDTADTFGSFQVPPTGNGSSTSPGSYRVGQKSWWLRTFLAEPISGGDVIPPVDITGMDVGPAVIGGYVNQGADIMMAPTVQKIVQRDAPGNAIVVDPDLINIGITGGWTHTSLERRWGREVSFGSIWAAGAAKSFAGAGWVLLDDLTSTDGQAYAGFLGQGPDVHWLLEIIDDDGTHVGVPCTTPLPNGPFWRSIRFERETNLVSVWINGSKAGEADISGLATITPSVDVGLTTGLNANIESDGFGIHLRALSDAEIQAIAATPVIPTTDDLIGIADLFPSAPPSAADITYDHTASGLEAEQVQAAIDELAARPVGGITSVGAVVVDVTDGLTVVFNNDETERHVLSEFANCTVFLVETCQLAPMVSHVLGDPVAAPDGVYLCDGSQITTNPSDRVFAVAVDGRARIYTDAPWRPVYAAVTSIDEGTYTVQLGDGTTTVANWTDVPDGSVLLSLADGTLYTQVEGSPQDNIDVSGVYRTIGPDIEGSFGLLYYVNVNQVTWLNSPALTALTTRVATLEAAAPATVVATPAGTIDLANGPQLVTSDGSDVATVVLPDPTLQAATDPIVFVNASGLLGDDMTIAPFGSETISTSTVGFGQTVTLRAIAGNWW